MEKLITFEEVKRRTTAGKTLLYKMIKSGRFPRGIPISARRKGWSESQVQAWIDRKIREAAEATKGAKK